MGAASKEDIKRWFKMGQVEKYGWMVVVYDGFDQADYPIYVDPHKDIFEVVKKYNNESNMSRVMEVYNLRKVFDGQQKNSTGTRVFDFNQAR